MKTQQLSAHVDEPSTTTEPPQPPAETPLMLSDALPISLYSLFVALVADLQELDLALASPVQQANQAVLLAEHKYNCELPSDAATRIALKLQNLADRYPQHRRDDQWQRGVLAATTLQLYAMHYVRTYSPAEQLLNQILLELFYVCRLIGAVMVRQATIVREGVRSLVATPTPQPGGNLSSLEYIPEQSGQPDVCIEPIEMPGRPQEAGRTGATDAEVASAIAGEHQKSRV